MVALVADRSYGLVISLLGVLRAGKAPVRGDRKSLLHPCKGFRVLGFRVLGFLGFRVLEF